MTASNIWQDSRILQLGVPHSVDVKDSSPMILARPKSATLTERFLSASRIFSGLISLCTILRSCCNALVVGNEDRPGSTHEILHTLEQLNKNLPTLLFRQFLLHHDGIEQLALWRQFKHQIHPIFLVESILQA